MKVSNTSVIEKSIGQKHVVEQNRDLASGQQSFEQQFNSSGREQYEQNMAELAKQINDRGTRLAQKINIAEMEQYRKLVSQFLNEVVSHAYAFQKENIFSRKGKRKIYALVMKINEKLEEMAQEILSDNQDAIKIVSNIDDIRGMIVDMLL